MVDLIKNATWAQIRQVVADPTIQVGLFGPPGVGKSHSLFTSELMPVTLIGAAGTRMKTHKPRRFIAKVQFHSEMSPAEIMGMHVPDGDKFRWESGPADLAYTRGGLLILDEV